MHLTTTKKHNIVYLVGHSARQECHLENIIPLVDPQYESGKNVGIVLMQDGVIGTSRIGTVPETLTYFIEMDIPVHVLAPDLKARGINPDQLIDKVDVITYEDLVDILAESNKVISIL
nr:DsrH/TusB family sulfur metabolism protein [Candidatus Sigynarchaeum springense]